MIELLEIELRFIQCTYQCMIHHYNIDDFDMHGNAPKNKIQVYNISKYVEYVILIKPLLK